ncbi:DUF6438 domain-containing protein [Dyadobacter sp. CY345]|uniref:DUF6438 domain-containing protein n=1 Tax=Dyadobacter sp. CY345 TaxID=2909335 RepID=UPI001F2D2202|nr:DUF6438 domain-containing protein [Dyadobacter sp. CY345]MCF2445172.1 DUF6438 domain-containing protein [Dyadobacter sp. CY345]
MRLVNYVIWTIWLLTSSSTPQVHQEYDRLIIGDWTFVKVELKNESPADSIEIPPLKVGSKPGYTFSESGFCENKLGYFTNDNRENTQFLGTETKYRIEGNRLLIFDLANNVWDRYVVLELDSKVLKLTLNDSANVIYEKSNYKLAPQVPFDQIVVSSSGCLGSCPINNVMVSKSGEVIIHNEHHTKNNGLYSSKMSSKQFRDLELKFRKANLKKLEDKYEASWTDDNEITISLIKNGRIYRTISDYGYQAPTELYWAYFPITLIDQKLTLNDLTSRDRFYIQKISSFEKGNKLIWLAKSESFYLANLLRTANSVNKKVVEKYTLHAYGEQGSIKATTDGRYYKIKSEDGKYVTLDLGYNFLQQNDLLVRLSAKLDYEK